MARSVIFVNNDPADWVLDELGARVVPGSGTLDVSLEISDDELTHAIQTGLGADFKDDPQGRYLRINGVDWTSTQSVNYGNQADSSSTPASAHNLGGAQHAADTLANLNSRVSDATLDDSGDPRDPNAHAPSHKPGGTDEVATATPAVDAIPKSGAITPTIHPDWIQDATETGKGKVELAANKESAPNVVVQGNDDRLSDARTPTAHKDTHKSGGGDAFLSTDLLEAIVKRLQESGGPTDLLLGSIPDTNVLRRTGTGIVGVAPATLVGGSPPQAHKDSHKVGGGDALLSTDLIDAVVRRLRETGGPTDLLLGAVPDLSLLSRSGTNIVGLAKSQIRSWGVTPGDNTGPGADTGSATPVILRYKRFPGTTSFGTPITLTVVARSSSGNECFVDLYNMSTGQILMTVSGIVSTAVQGAIYTTTTIVNPFPTGAAIIAIRGYRGGAAATLSLFDLTLT